MSTVPPTMRALRQVIRDRDETIVAGIDAGGIGLEMKICASQIDEERCIGDVAAAIAKRKWTGKSIAITKNRAVIIRTLTVC